MKKLIFLFAVLLISAFSFNATAVAPVITSFSPTSGTIGTTVIITGTGFDTTPANNIVYFGAVQASVSASTATTITVTVPAQAGSIVPVSVMVGGLTAYSINSTTPTFNLTNTPNLVLNYTTSTYTAGTTPVAVAIGDFNGDGKADMVVANSNSANVSIFLSDGAGSFGAATNFAVGTQPWAIAVGDFNGDGKADMAVANQGSSNVSILLGNGNGTFSTATNFAAGICPASVAIGDFNGDGKADLAIANKVPPGNVSILLGNGDGSFGAATNFAVGNNPYTVAIGDFNNDGKADLAIANITSSNVSILLGNGDGSFGAATNFAVGSWSLSVAIGDFNGDGNADLVVANANDNNVSILLGDGAGSFGAATNFAVGTVPYAVAIGDFNGDGKTDLAVASNGSVSILLGNGDGSFGVKTDFATGIYGLYFVAIGDYNGDGKADMVAVGTNVYVLLYTTPPSIISATYNAATGALVVTGTDFAAKAGAANDIVVSNLTLTGEGGATYTLTSANVDITSATQFTVTLNATDKTAVNPILNKNGISSFSGTTYNLSATEDWDAGTASAATIADLTGNGITVSNVAVPTITSATYSVISGALIVTGTGFLQLAGATNDIDVSKLTLTGEGGATYTLTTASVEITTGTQFTVTLNATDLAAVNLILNKNGTSSNDATTYNLAAAEDWAAGADPAVVIADLTANGIAVGDINNPTITNATYDATTGTLVVTGTNFAALTGVTNDIVVSDLTLTGEGGATYTLTTGSVEITSGTSFTVSLNATDLAAVNPILNKNGVSSTGGTTYNIAAAEDWNAGAEAASTIADLTGNGITVSNVAVPTITSATYNAATGALVVTGTGFLKLAGANNDIVVTKLTITGEGTRTLASPKVEITSATQFTVTLNAADKAAVNQIMNKNGSISTGGTTYDLAAAEDWDAGAEAVSTIADLTGNGITVSNVAVPTITSATYNVVSGALVVTGIGLFQLSGAANDIDVSKLTLTGDGGSTYALTTGSVEITSGTQFTITLNATDKTAVNLILNKNGTSSISGTTYNLAAAEDWNAGADPAVVIADLTGNGITVSYIPTITSATYNAGTGALVVTGVNFKALAGSANDIVVSKLTLKGDGGATYTLTSPNVDYSLTRFTVTLNTADKAAVNQILNKNGTSSAGGTTYNLAAAEDWNAGVDAALVIADLTGNGITVSNLTTITSATYNVVTGALVVTGTYFTALAGAANDIVVPDLTLTGEGGATYTLTSANVDITSPTQFTVSLNATDIAAVSLILNKNGTSSASGTTFNLAAAEDWDAGANAALTIADLTGNGIFVSNIPSTTITSFSPASGTIGTTVTINGTNFSTTPANNIVYFGAVKATVSASTATTITVTVPAQAGSVVPLSVTVGGMVAYSTTSTTPTFNLTNTPNLVPNYTSSTIGVGSQPKSVAIGDFNGDGKADLAVANMSSDNVSIRLGNGDGSFGIATNFAAGSGPESVAIGDFNGDGKTDLAVANSSSDNISILQGNGAGSFGAATNFAAGNKPYSIAIGDFNGDGNADLAVANNVSSNVSILLGNSDGSFGAVTNFAAGSNPIFIAIGDFNGDGKADLAMANPGSDNVSILLGNGNGSFGAATNFAVGTDPFSVAIGDFNGDGKADLAVANRVSNTVSILLGNGAGGFGAATNFAAGSSPQSIAIGDFNGDGKTDLAVANQSSDNISILQGNGAGSFGTATNFNVGDLPFSVAIGDFNGDGAADLAVANYYSNNVSILLYTTPPAITNATYDASSGALVVTGTDFVALAGAANDIIVPDITLTGEGGATYTLTSANVEITSSTQFTVTLNATDLAAINLILNKNGTSSFDGTTYNLAAAEDWDAGANAALIIADLTGNGITVSNIVTPPVAIAATNITSTGFTANWNASSGATGYYFDVATDNGFTSFVPGYNNLDVGNVNIYAVSASTNGNTYYYRVKAYNGGYTSASSTTITVTNAIPAVTTTAISSVTSTSATSGGKVTNDGGSSVTARGVCWNTTGTPIITDNLTSDGTGTGSYTSSITGLTANTLYYVRAYATNSIGTAYGNEVSFTPLKNSQTVTFDPLPAKTFGDGNFPPVASASSGLAVTFSSSNTDVATIVGSDIHIVGAGSANIAANQSGNDNYNAATEVIQILTVSKAMLTVTSDPKTKVYGEANPTLTFQYSGWVNGVEAIDVAPSITTTVDATTIVGTYADAITLSGGLDNNYTFSLVSGDLEVTKAVLTATADNQTKVYGEANDALTIQYSGWQNGNGIADLATAPTAGTTVTVTSPVAVYANAITLSGGVDENYSFSYVAANYEVTKAVLTVTADAKTKVYGAANPALTFQYNGWQNGDGIADLATAPTASTTVTVTSPVAVYANAITLTGGVDENYSFSYVAANYEVTKAVLTATADNHTKVYGEANPVLKFQYSGWVNGVETIDVAPSIITTLDGTTIVGIYNDAITLSGGLDNNYTFSLVSGDLEVTKAVLTATADNQTKVYGEANPALTFLYSGWVNGVETIDVAPSITTTVDGTTIVGTYDINITGGNDNNYDLNLVNGSLEIDKAPLVIIAEDKAKTYLEPNPELTFTWSGFVSGQNQDVIDVVPALETDADKNSDAGTYDIIASGGVDGNYSFTYENGILTINKADQVITFEDIPAGLRTTQEHKLNAETTSGLSITFETSDAKIGSIDGDLLTVNKEGNLTITASQPGNHNWNPAPDVIQSIITLVTFDNISSLFTPNNDGMNDYWYIPNLIEFGNVQVTVYNRFGQAVYKSDSYNNNWDGTWNGYPLPSASYYYIMKSSVKGYIKGVVNLVR